MLGELACGTLARREATLSHLCALPHIPSVNDDEVMRFGVAVIGDPGERRIATFVRDADDQVIGGMLGHITWRWLYVARLWLLDVVRGRGMGRRIMERVERFAWENDCLAAYLDTCEYRALPFYQKLGNEVWGKLDGFPPGYRQFYLRKLRPADSISG